MPAGIAVLDRISRREHFTGRGDLVLADELGDHTDPSTLRRAYASARDTVLEAAAKEGDELPRLTFHGLRHCFGSRCAAAGVPLASSRPGWVTPTSRPRWSTSTSCRTPTMRHA
ncbi:MAG TPA: hypothetical protein VFF79_19765 [Conexibacter sp.]|jgi:integrase|nr:hypothetical protein [Conexibacter sp.]